ncbi:hypothetical protein FB451DRAFT_1492379 [Mycena latifolia]|nr:hypothetical protein FB451DRAFT_1492379 [Mycena latifolia]
MPVTFCREPPPNPVSWSQGTDGSYTARQVLQLACEPQAWKAGEIFQSSRASKRGKPERKMLDKILPFKKSKETKATPVAAQTTSNIIPTRNGLVDTVILAYNKHHALVLRPDGVWLAILTEFNYFVNANSELLPASFVAHEGKRELVIVEEGTRYSLDFRSHGRLNFLFE